MLDPMRHYAKFDSQQLRVLGKRRENGIESQLVVFQTPFGYRRTAELVRPEVEGSQAAILYVHWYEPESHDSNRRQFVEEAKQMARSGAVTLLIETAWSDPDFFLKRTQEDDPQISIEEVVNIRRALDWLVVQPGIDSDRLAYVGHDFGGMYGVLAGSLDRRPGSYVIMAATPRFPDWYLYAPKLEGQAREAFVRQMSKADPIAHIGNLSPASILFQFGTHDPHVPKERAEEFFAAANQPKEMKWYDSGHGLNELSVTDRIEWLKQKLRLN